MQGHGASRSSGPRLMTVGTEFLCLEEAESRWSVLSAGHIAPQDARDSLACEFRTRERDTEDEAERAELVRAYELLDRERIDEMRVAGRRYRIGRLERFCEVGPDGPVLPLPTDPDDEPGTRAEHAPRRVLGAINVNARTASEAAMLRYELRNKTPADGDPRMQHDAWDALNTYPRVMIMPTEFALAQQEDDGSWTRVYSLKPTPQAVRDALASSLRFECGADHPDPETAKFLTGLPSPGPERVAELCAAADMIDRERPSDFTAAGRRYRIARTEQLIRLGNDGPEPPRPSDPDPEGPPATYEDLEPEDEED